MVARALEWLDVQPEDRVLDLFCGMGNFTLPLATQAASVVGVEGVPALVEKGQQNARLNGLQNVTFYHENLEEDVTKQPWAKNGFDKVLLDPARAGAAGVMQQIIKLEPIRIVYVSCNPATLARDSEALLKQDIPLRDWRCWICSHTRDIWNRWYFSRALNSYDLPISAGLVPKGEDDGCGKKCTYQ